MEKISRILPSSPRFKNPDIKSAGVARSGTASFGRPVGVSALARPALDEVKPLDPRAAIVDRVSSAFFMKRNEAPTPAQEAEIDQILAKFQDVDSDLNPATASVRDGDADEAPAIGGNLNIVA